RCGLALVHLKGGDICEHRCGEFYAKIAIIGDLCILAILCKCNITQFFEMCVPSGVDCIE
ncbi:MAG: hypothetical protein ACJAZF_002264, partial [Granulosicoccus sp.]